MQRLRRYSALSRQIPSIKSYESELYAGAALHLAGFSSGTSVGARRGCSAQRVRFYYGVLRVVHVCLAFLLEAFASVHACCLTHSAKQDGLRCVAFLFREGRDRLSVRFHIVLWLSGFVGSLGAYAFLGQAISTGLRAEFLRGRLYEKERRDWVAFLLIWTAFLV